MKYVLYLIYLLPLFLSAQTGQNNGVAAPVIEEYDEQQWEAATEGLDYSRDVTSTEAPPVQKKTPAPVATRDIEDSNWSRAIEDVDYSRDQPEIPTENHTAPGINGLNWTAQTMVLGKILQILAVILAITLIGYGIYQMLQVPKNRKIAQDGVEITVDNIEQYLQESDLAHFLREAIAQGNYALAIRLYYLQVIKTLSEKNTVAWSLNKTNRDYLREMAQHRMFPLFRNITRTYERVWYGNQALDLHGFKRLEPEFKSLLSALSSQ